MTGIAARFTGRLGADAVLKWVKGGTLPLVTLAVAVSTGRDEPIWVRVACFGELAEKAGDWLKGSKVSIEGRLTLATWCAADGTPRSGLNVVAERAALGYLSPRAPAPAKRAKRKATRPDHRTDAAPDPDLNDSVADLAS